MLTLKAIKPTFLKRDPTKQSQELAPEAKYFLPIAATYEITSSAPAANQHIQITLKQPLNGSVTWFAYGPHVQVFNQPTPLEAAKDRQQVFNNFLTIEIQQGCNQNKLAFLDKGITGSFVESQIDTYPDRLQKAPDGKLVVSMGATLLVPSTNQTITVNAYPKRGDVPVIDQSGLSFLHADIQEACICMGSYVNGQMQAYWLGRNALSKGQFWSATKIVPILNVVAQANAKSSTTRIKDCMIRDANQQQADWNFTETAIDIISYRKDDIEKDILVSNRLSDTLKRFSSLPSLEKWLTEMTGNKNLEFRGYYSGDPLIQEPTLQAGTTTILRAQPAGAAGENLVSAYDLTRLISMLVWHFHLPPDAKLPACQWHSLETVVRSLGYDSARYLDGAIDLLGLNSAITTPVILSKLGFGASELRQRTELCYTAFVQFVDARSHTTGQPAPLKTLAMTLRAAVQKLDPAGKRDLDEEARWLDARMAAEVTEIVRRVVTEELLASKKTA